MRAQHTELAHESQLKEEFLATVCHELRSPLGAIQNAVKVLRAQPILNVPLLQKMHELIERQAAQMGQLVAGLLDITRVARGELNLQREPIELKAVLRNSVQTLEWDLQQRNHHLTISEPDAGVWLAADAARLEQVFVNVLGNASKYTQVPGQIHLTLDLEGGNARVRIRDSGVGIAPETLPHIFDLFMQAQPIPPRTGSGLGIGLALVRAIVQAHGGIVTAASAGLGLGSEFTVCLPLA
jgi:signal transduction histidine kinase